AAQRRRLALGCVRPALARRRAGAGCRVIRSGAAALATAAVPSTAGPGSRSATGSAAIRRALGGATGRALGRPTRRTLRARPAPTLGPEPTGTSRTLGGPTRRTLSARPAPTLGPEPTGPGRAPRSGILAAQPTA